MANSTVRIPKYKLGDKVKLIVGGPDMAIREVTNNHDNTKFIGSYKCQWFAGKKLDWGSFPEENLILVTEQSKESES